MLPESVIIGERSDGRRTGEGVVLFKSEQDAIRAQGEKKGQNIGRRYIEIFVYPFSNYSQFMFSNKTNKETMNHEPSSLPSIPQQDIYLSQYF